MIHRHRKDERVERGNAGRLCGAEHAGPDTADDDDRGQQRKKGFLGGLADFLPAELLDRVIALLCHKEDQDAAGQRQAETRNNTADKQRADGNFGHHAVNDHRDAGRDDGADRGGGGRHCRGEVRVKAVLDHGVNFDLPESAGIGNRRAAHARENDRCHNVRMAQAAGDRADPR